MYTAIGSQTAVTFDRKTSMIDTTDKSTAEKQFMAGLREETITLGNLYVPNDTAFQALRTAWKTNTAIIVERQESGTVLEYANALISQMTEDFKMAAAGTVSLTLQVRVDPSPRCSPVGKANQIWRLFGLSRYRARNLVTRGCHAAGENAEAGW